MVTTNCSLYKRFSKIKKMSIFLNQRLQLKKYLKNDNWSMLNWLDKETEGYQYWLMIIEVHMRKVMTFVRRWNLRNFLSNSFAFVLHFSSMLVWLWSSNFKSMLLSFSKFLDFISMWSNEGDTAFLFSSSRKNRDNGLNSAW